MLSLSVSDFWVLLIFCYFLLIYGKKKGVGGRYTFSLAQWQELELQALIYRHMAAGASVPPELLQLVKKSLLTSSTAPYYLHHYSPHFQPAAAAACELFNLFLE